MLLWYRRSVERLACLLIKSQAQVHSLFQPSYPIKLPALVESTAQPRGDNAMSQTNYKQLIIENRLKYHQQLINRETRPFVLPLGLFNYILLVLCLALPPRSRRILRYPTLLIIILLSGDTLFHCGTLGLAYGVLPGISAAWCVLLSLNHLFLGDPPEKLVRRQGLKEGPHGQNEQQSMLRAGSGILQPMPKKLPQRLCWIVDLLGSMRGLHWSSLETHSRGAQLPAIIRANTIPSYRQCLVKLFAALLGIDILKEVIAADPYFWPGHGDKYPLSLRSLNLASFLLHAYRMLAAFFVIHLGVHVVANTGIIVFVYTLGPRYLGTWGCEWACAPAFGDFSVLGSHGLLGFWGSWWHQFFRSNLRAPASALTNLFPTGGHLMVERQIRMAWVFLLSGVIHACGSQTMWGATIPFKQLTFFMLQHIGISIQIFLSLVLESYGPTMASRLRIRKFANLAFAVLWLLLTAPFLVDDFAQGGFFLGELVPFSLLSILGPSRRSSSVLLYNGLGVSWYTGDRWWQSGIAL